LKFGGYGFNKSHSTRYAIIAFQTAYMKAYHPVEYMAALLTFEMGNTDKVVEYIEECRRMTLADGTKGIRVLPPDVNVSEKDFTPVYLTREDGKRKKKSAKPEGVIRFGLVALRGVGEKAVETIAAERKARGPFKSLYDFTERVDLRVVQRATIEALIKCGAFASLGARRSQLLHILERAVEMGQQTQQDRRSGQLNMFGMGSPVAVSQSSAPIALPDIEEFSNAELLKFEKELLGFYITSHPLTAHQATIERYSTASTREAMNLSADTEITIGGMINRVRKVPTKTGRSAGQLLAMITLEDLEGQMDAVLFADTLAEVNGKHPDSVAVEQIVFLKGRIDRRRETPSIVVSELIPIEQAVSRLTTGLLVKLDGARHEPGIVRQIKPILSKYTGRLPIYIEICLPSSGTTVLKINGDMGVKAKERLLEDLDGVLGAGGAQLIGAGTKRQRRLAQQQLFKEDAAIQEATAAAAEELLSEPSADELPGPVE
jgi:DNA polymerase-3 subunit alpha